MFLLARALAVNGFDYLSCSFPIFPSSEDEIAFLKSMYEEKIRQLMDWDFGTEDFRAMFSNELALALKDIRAEYDGLLEANRGADTESW